MRLQQFSILSNVVVGVLRTFDESANTLLDLLMPIRCGLLARQQRLHLLHQQLVLLVGNRYECAVSPAH